jgi:hypothetical protein
MSKGRHWLGTLLSCTPYDGTKLAFLQLFLKKRRRWMCPECTLRSLKWFISSKRNHWTNQTPGLRPTSWAVIRRSITQTRFSCFETRRLIRMFSKICRAQIQSTHFHMIPFLGAFAKLRKTTISFVMSVPLSVRVERLRCNWTDFHEIWYLNMSRKSVEKIRVSL